MYWPDFDPTTAHLTQSSGDYEPIFFNEANDKYRVVECWYRKAVRTVWFINPYTVQPENLSPKEFKKFDALVQQGNTAAGIPPGEPLNGIPGMVDEVHYALFSGITMLESGMSPYKYKGFPCVICGAYKNEEMNKWFGAIRMMVDPQQSLNTMRRQLSHLLQTLPKGMLVHEAGAVLNIDEYEQRSADPTFHLEVAVGHIDKVRFEHQPQISPIYQMLDQTYSQAIKDASGIQDTLMGVQTSSREPGVTVARRQETGLAVLYMLYDNFAETRTEAGKILLSLMQQYVTAETAIRIEGEKGKYALMINSQTNPANQGFNDISAGEFDLETDDTVETKTSRMATAEILAGYNQNNPGAIPPDIILEYSDIPFSTIQRVKQVYAAQQAQQQANIEADREIEMMKINADLRKADNALKASKQKQAKGD
jgi:hypothetical protein